MIKVDYHDEEFDGEFEEILDRVSYVDETVDNTECVMSVVYGEDHVIDGMKVKLTSSGESQEIFINYDEAVELLINMKEAMGLV